MGRSESSILARKSGMSGVGYLWDIADGLSICVSCAHACSYVWPSMTRNLRLPGKILWRSLMRKCKMGILIPSQRAVGGNVTMQI